MMEHPAIVLANIENFGKIYKCGDCDNIHVHIGPVNVTINVDAYMQLVAVVNSSAANFETLIARSRTGNHERF